MNKERDRAIGRRQAAVETALHEWSDGQNMSTIFEDVFDAGVAHERKRSANLRAALNYAKSVIRQVYGRESNFLKDIEKLEDGGQRDD
jgi:hypothetical protein